MTYTTNTFQSGNWAVEYDNAETGEHCHHEYATSDNAYEDYLYSQNKRWRMMVTVAATSETKPSVS